MLHHASYYNIPVHLPLMILAPWTYSKNLIHILHLFWPNLSLHLTKQVNPYFRWPIIILILESFKEHFLGRFFSIVWCNWGTPLYIKMLCYCKRISGFLILVFTYIPTVECSNALFQMLLGCVFKNTVFTAPVKIYIILINNMCL